jgi:gamma-glutamylcyclotransferase
MWDFYDKRFHLYFMYGSNMNNGQIRARCTKPEVFTVARLPNHRMAFHGYTRTWDGAEETIVQCAGKDTWGVIYKLTFSDAEKLDAWQDVRMDGGGRYFHCPVSVYDTTGRCYPALTYKKDVLNAPAVPSTEYIDHIISGAVFHGLPYGYVEGLRMLDKNRAGYPVPLGSRFDRSLLADLSCDCGTDQESKS